MQVMPVVGREWATETGMRELERKMASYPANILHIRNETFRSAAGTSKRSTNSFGTSLTPRCEWLPALQCRRKPRGRMEPPRPAGQRNRERSSSTASTFDQSPMCFRSCNAPRQVETELPERRVATDFSCQMTTTYTARWVLPVAPPIEHGAVVSGERMPQ